MNLVNGKLDGIGKVLSLTSAEEALLDYNNNPGSYIWYNSDIKSLRHWKDNVVRNIITESVWTLVHTEDFETGTLTSMGISTTLHNSTSFYLSTLEHHDGSRSMLISNNGGNNTSYGHNVTCHAYMQLTFPSNIADARISAWWKGLAEVGYDGVKVFLCDTSVNITAGIPLVSNSNTIIQIGNNMYNGVSGWTNTEISLSAIVLQLAGTTKNMVIQFTSDGSIIGTPGFVIDSFKFEVKI